jgi:hypothetical protein
MGAVNTTYTFTATDTITSTKMNNIIDETVMTGDAVLGGSGGSGGLDIASGKLSISANAINSSRLASSSVTTNAITNGNVTPEKLSTYAPTWSSGTTSMQPGLELGGGITTNQSSYVDFHAVPGTDYESRIIRGAGANGDLAIENTGTGLVSIAHYGAGAVTLQTSSQERMRITASGNVGIGTGSPVAPLHVNGGFKVTATENNNFSATVSNSGTTNAYGLIVESNNSAYALAVRDKSNVYRFRVGADGTVSMGGAGNSFNINAGGNVGVGTTTPSTKLQVNGTVTATAFSGPLTGDVTGNVTGSSGSCTGNAATATLATKASTLSNGGGNGSAMTFNWNGQGGQPTWLWGGNDGVNHYVYNPANFSVNYATSAGSATTASTVSNSAITAAKLDGNQSGSAPIYGCRAWVSFVGRSTNGDCTIRSAGNVTRVARTAEGRYTVYFATHMQDAEYATIAGSDANTAHKIAGVISQAEGSVDIAYSQIQTSTSRIDPTWGQVSIFR